MCARLLLLLAPFLLCSNAIAHPITIKITDIRNSNGHIQLAIFETAQQFDDDAPIARKRFSKTSVKNGQLTITLELPPGTYGIGLLDDENNDKTMNYNFIGMPQEGFGFSDYYHTGWSRPEFDDFDFEHKSTSTLTMKVRYI